MSAQMAFNASNLARIATLVGRDDEVAALRSQHAELAQLINTKCYDEKRGFYFDHYDGAIVPRYHAGSFWVLIADIVPPERLARFVTVLRDPAKFNRPVPVPALSADDPDYAPETGYWRGSVWPPTTYMLLRGLRKVGEEELAKDFARRNYAAHAALYRATGTVWENISPEQCERPKAHSGRDFCGWSALTPIAIAKEFLA
jgi:glycogen debranching enzyme